MSKTWHNMTSPLVQNKKQRVTISNRCMGAVVVTVAKQISHCMTVWDNYHKVGKIN